MRNHENIKNIWIIQKSYLYMGLSKNNGYKKDLINKFLEKGALHKRALCSRQCTSKESRRPSETQNWRQSHLSYWQWWRQVWHAGIWKNIKYNNNLLSTEIISTLLQIYWKKTAVKAGLISRKKSFHLPYLPHSPYTWNWGI